MAAAFNLTAQINLQGPANLKPIVAKIKKELGAIKTDINIDIKAASAKNIANITTKLQALSKAAKTTNSDVLTLGQSLSQLAAGFNTLASSSSSAINGVNTTTKGLASAKKNIAQTRSEIEEFGKQSGLAIRRFAAFSTVTSVVYGLTNAFNSAFKEFVSFNREIVRLSQVTGQSVGELKSVTDEIFRLSTSIGVASSDLLQVSTTLAQAGLSASETKIALEALAKSALAPSFDNITETTEGAIAILRQFGLQAGDLESALGSVNAVAAAFAVEASDLITAVQRTGGVFAASSRGVSEGTDALNEFLAIFTSVRATTRESAETIATGLRTIFTRIQRESTIEALKGIGIELRNAEGQFVGAFEAVRRLSEGLNSIDPRSAQFARISEELGGFRQIGKVIPLIQQFATAQEALKVAQRGQASLAEDVVTAQQALAIQFTKTRENFLKLVNDLGNSTTFKATTNVIFALTNGLISLAGALEPLLPLLLTFTTIKLGSAFSQFSTGFGRGLFGGGGGIGGVGPAPQPPSGPAGTPGNQQLTSALTLLNTSVSTLNSSILALNQNIVNNNSLLLNRPGTRGFASGGLVPGRGNRDTVRAMLTPGEFVIRKKAVEAIGAQNLAKMNRGGLVQKFAVGGNVEDRIKYRQGQLNEFGLVGLRSGTETGFGLRSSQMIDLGKKYGSVMLHIATLAEEQQAIFADTIESIMSNSFVSSIKLVSTQLSKQLRVPSPAINQGNLEAILKGSGLANVVGAGLESAIALSGAEYWDKTESTKSIDFPFGLGATAGLFGNFPSDIPTDVTKTIGSPGKGQSKMKEQIQRFIDAVLGQEFTKAQETRAGAASAGRLAPILQAQIDKLITNVGGGGAEAFSSADSYSSFTKKWGRLSLGTKSTMPYLSRLPESQQDDFIADYTKLVDEVTRKGIKLKRRAVGGGISGKDTVPALLTPGEFVINKQAASKIGYSQLHRLNKADKIRGYNKGGVVGGVQRFANGGPALSFGDAALAISAILVPQIERLASSFDKLEGKVGEFGTSFGNAVREASSLALSASVGLKTTGASEDQVRRGVAIAGIGGAIGGAVSGFSSKSLENSLKENTDALSRFDKLVRQAAETTDENERIRISQDLDAEFIKLTQTIRENEGSLDLSERFKNLGDAISGALNTTLVFQTSILAINQAFIASAAAQQANIVATNANTAAQTTAAAAAAGATGVAGAVGVAGAATAARGILPVIKVIASGATKFLGLIGVLITAIQIGIGVYKFFFSSTKKAGEETLKLSESLKQATINSNRFSINNIAYANKTLTLFNRLNNALSSGQITRQERTRALGSILTPINPQVESGISVRTESGQEFFVRELNLLLREQLETNLAIEGIALGLDQSIADLANSLSGERRDTFNRTLITTLQNFLKDRFIAARRAGGATQQAAESEFTTLLTAKRFAQIDNTISEFDASTNSAKLAADSLTLASKGLRDSFITLDNVINGFVATVAARTSDFEISIKQTNDVIDSLRGSPTLAGRPTAVGERARILGNIEGFSVERIQRSLDDTFANIGVGISDSIDFQNIQKETTGLILGIKKAQESFPSVLAQFAGGKTVDRNKITEIFENLFKDLPVGPGVVSSVSEAISQSLESGKPLTSFDDVLKLVPELGTSFENAKKIVLEYNQSVAKANDLILKAADDYAKTLGRINELSVQRARLQAEFGTRDNLGTAIREAFGGKTSGRELNQQFNEELRIRLKGITDSLDPTELGRVFLEQVELLRKIQNDPTRPGEDQRVVSDRIQRLSSVINDLTDSGEALKRAQDDLAERSRQLFEAPQDLFEELLRDPSRALDIQRQQRSVSRIEAGERVGRVEIVNALDFAKVIERFNPQRALEIRGAALRAGGLRMEQTTRTPAEGIFARLLTNILGATTPQQRAKIQTPELTELEAIVARTGAALSAGETIRQKELEVLDSTVQGYNQYLTDLSTEFAKEIQARRELNAIISQSRGQSAVKAEEGIQVVAVSNQLKDLAEQLIEIRTVTPVVTPGGAMAVESIKRTNALASFGIDPSILSLGFKDVETALQAVEQVQRQIQQQIIPKQFGGGGIDPEILRASRAFRVELDTLRSNLLRIQEESQRLRQPPTQPQAIAPPQTFIPDLSKTFGSLVSDFRGETNNFITELNKAFSNLNISEPIKQFSKAATALVSGLENFNNQGGIKVGNIPQEVRVAVVFDENLVVEAERSNTNENLLAQIGILVDDAIKNKLNELRFGRVPTTPG